MAIAANAVSAEINTKILVVARTAADTSVGASQSRLASAELAEMSSDLQVLVARFTS